MITRAHSINIRVWVEKVCSVASSMSVFLCTFIAEKYAPLHRSLQNLYQIYLKIALILKSKKMSRAY